MKCPTCGVDVPDDAVFCPSCGTRKQQLEKTLSVLPGTC